MLSSWVKFSDRDDSCFPKWSSMYRDEDNKYPVTEFPVIKSAGYRVRALGSCLFFVFFLGHTTRHVGS